MKKYYLLAFIVICTLIVNAQSIEKTVKLTSGPKVQIKKYKTSENNIKAVIKTFKYDNNEIASGIGVNNKPYILGTFIELPNDLLSASINKTIDIIRIGIDNISIISNATITIYEDSLNSLPVLQQSINIDSIIKGWNMFTLTNGYKIIGNKNIFVGIVIETNSGGYTQTYDTDPATSPLFSGHTILNNEYYGTLYSKIGIDADYNIQALITDGQGVNFADLTITNIQSTSNNCQFSDNEALTVTIINKGIDAFEGQFDLSVEINNKTVVRQVTPTVIEPNEKIIVRLPAVNMRKLGIYNINANIDVPDSNTDNNKYSTKLYSGNAKLRIEVLTDMYPEDTYWVLCDNKGNLIAESNTLEAETQYNNEICVINDSCYIWEIYDANGDGLSGKDTSHGSFNIYYNDTIIATSPADGNFGYKFRVAGIGKGCLQNDIAISEILIPTYEKPTTLDITGIIVNNGTDTIKYFDVIYKIDDYSSPLLTITDINIPYGEYYEFTHNVPYNFDIEKSYNIQIICTNPNGKADDYTYDNVKNHIITINSNVIPKKQLIEHFTSSTNDACFNFTPLLDELLSNNFNDYSLIRYQVNRPEKGDPYYIEQTNDRCDFYNVGIIPSVYRNSRFDLDYSQDVFNKYAEQKTIIDIKAKATYYDYTVSVLAVIKPVIHIDSGLTANIAIVENSTFGNAGTNGENEFYNVIMQMLPDSKGTAINEIALGSSQIIDENFDMSTTFVEEMNDLTAVIFVQNNLTKEIIQSTMVSIELTDNILQNSDLDYLIYPNPFLNSITVENTVNIRVIILSDILGREVYKVNMPENKIIIPTYNLKKGIYFITIIDKDSKVIVEKAVKK